MRREGHHTGSPRKTAGTKKQREYGDRESREDTGRKWDGEEERGTDRGTGTETEKNERGKKRFQLND